MKRRMVAGTAVTAVLVIAGCTSTGDDAASTTTSAPATLANDPASTLSDFVARHPDVMAHSNPAMVRGTPVAAVGRRGEHGQVITVLSLADGEASPLADLVLPEPSFDLATDLPVVVADVTGDGAAEFLVRVAAADTNPGVVLSDDGGSWRLVPASGDPDDVYFAREPRFMDNRLVTQLNDCVPTCASGRTTMVTWMYNRATAHFING